jgi:hypothetical protein
MMSYEHGVILIISILLIFWLVDIVSYRQLEDGIYYTADQAYSVYYYLEKNLVFIVLIIAILSVMLLP